jgi:putative hydrolase of the HAD superfamily
MADSPRRLFFDSGMVLVRPESGDWFYPVAYREYCARKGLPEKSVRQSLNFPRAYARLSARRIIRTVDEEYAAFLEFYSILFGGVKGKDDADLAEICAEATAYDPGKYRFYDDVADAIPRLKVFYDLGIISDAWPSLLGVYRAANMLRHFEPFIISSNYGCTKRSGDLFKFALANVAEHAEECLFIDDSPDNCRMATRLGMRAVILNRNKHYRGAYGIPKVGSMAELESLLGK